VLTPWGVSGCGRASFRVMGRGKPWVNVGKFRLTRGKRRVMFWANNRCSTGLLGQFLRALRGDFTGSSI